MNLFSVNVTKYYNCGANCFSKTSRRRRGFSVPLREGPRSIDCVQNDGKSRSAGRRGAACGQDEDDIVGMNEPEHLARLFFEFVGIECRSLHQPDTALERGPLR